MVSCQWSVVSGQWSVVGGQWSVVGGQWSVVGGPCARSQAQGGGASDAVDSNGNRFADDSLATDANIAPRDLNEGPFTLAEGLPVDDRQAPWRGAAETFQLDFVE